jgi:integrase
MDFCKECGLKYFNMHDLRRSFISLLKNKGVPVKIVSELVGHSSVSQTEKVYSVIDKDIQREELAKLSGSIKLKEKEQELKEETRRFFTHTTKPDDDNPVEF